MSKVKLCPRCKQFVRVKSEMCQYCGCVFEAFYIRGFDKTFDELIESRKEGQD